LPAGSNAVGFGIAIAGLGTLVTDDYRVQDAAAQEWQCAPMDSVEAAHASQALPDAGRRTGQKSRYA
jgi:hypothetical protein